MKNHKTGYPAIAFALILLFSLTVHGQQTSDVLDIAAEKQQYHDELIASTDSFVKELLLPCFRRNGGHCRVMCGGQGGIPDVLVQNRAVFEQRLTELNINFDYGASTSSRFMFQPAYYRFTW